MRKPRSTMITTLAGLSGALLSGIPSLALAANPIGLYVGGGMGQANVKVESLGFDEHHASWKAFVGIRPISAFGIEAQYVDFGQASAAGFGGTSTQGDAKTNGAAAFAIGYLPIPIPDLDIFAKAGLSRLKTSASGTSSSTCTQGNSNCQLFSFSTTDTTFAWGVGAQFMISKIGVRAEYERFGGGSSAPHLISASVIWKF